MAMPPGAIPHPDTLASGRFRLVEMIGTGGMASVWRATDGKTGEDCAIKVLLPVAARSEKARTRFQQEAATMSLLRHPNIVRILANGDEAGWSFFAMDLCERGSLAAHVKRVGPRPPVEAARYAFEALLALDYAHAKGVVHRDIKPHNMLLDGDLHVRLTDFGIARVLSQEGGPRLTGTGDTLGTLAYMSPEQRLDPRKAGPHADLYGVGATIYMLVTGRRPFDLAMATLDPSVLERLPAPLRPVVRRATAHRAQDRYPTARAMGEALSEAWGSLDPSGPMPVERMNAFDDEEPTVTADRSA